MRWDWVFGMVVKHRRCSGDSRFLSITYLLADALADVPVIGLIYSELLRGHNILVIWLFAMVPVTYWHFKPFWLRSFALW